MQLRCTALSLSRARRPLRNHRKERWSLKLTRHNGRAGKHGTYNPKHNDRSFEITNSEHIDPERVQQNIYWDSLILTFVALFIFIGNLGRIEAFSGWLQNILAGHEVLVSVLASQVTSNVPAAILLSGFTDNFRALIIGTDLGGLGTLIASMASLISYRQIANEVPAEKGHYFAMFTISNVVFLAILMGAWALT